MSSSVAHVLGHEALLVAGGSGARARGDDDRVPLAVEHGGEGVHVVAGDLGGLLEVAGVGVHLAAADLSLREADLVAEALQDGDGCLRCLREHGVRKTGGEKGDSHDMPPRRRSWDCHEDRPNCLPGAGCGAASAVSQATGRCQRSSDDGVLLVGWFCSPGAGFRRDGAVLCRTVLVRERGVRGVWEVSPRPGLRHGSLLLSDPRAQVRTERVRGRRRRMRTYLRREDCVSL